MYEALNKQLNAEFYSAYLYLSMATYFESTDLKGFTNWMKVQSQEELTHAMKLYDHIIERSAKVTLRSIDAPPVDWTGPLEIFKATLTHEQKVTGLINDLVHLARREKDDTSEIFLQWFVNEQVEEEESVAAVLEQLKLVKGSPQALFMMDKEMARRKFVRPVAMKRGV